MTYMPKWQIAKPNVTDLAVYSVVLTQLIHPIVR